MPVFVSHPRRYLFRAGYMFITIGPMKKLCTRSRGPATRVTCHGNQDSLRLVLARAVACRPNETGGKAHPPKTKDEPEPVKETKRRRRRRSLFVFTESRLPHWQASDSESLSCTGSRLPGLTRQGGKHTLQRPKTTTTRRRRSLFVFTGYYRGTQGAN